MDGESFDFSFTFDTTQTTTVFGSPSTEAAASPGSEAGSTDPYGDGPQQPSANLAAKTTAQDGESSSVPPPHCSQDQEMCENSDRALLVQGTENYSVNTNV